MVVFMWYERVKSGDFLDIDPHWNRTSGLNRQVPEPVEVLEVIKETRSLSNVIFYINSRSGLDLYLDASWFKGIHKGELV